MSAEPAAIPARALTLVQAMSEARRAVALFTELPVDAVVSCAREGEGWAVIVDVVETRARLGANDMLASYRVALDAGGEVTDFRREGRYLREDAAARGARG